MESQSVARFPSILSKGFFPGIREGGAQFASPDLVSLEIDCHLHAVSAHVMLAGMADEQMFIASEGPAGGTLEDVIETIKFSIV